MSARSWMARLGVPGLALLLALCFAGVAQAAQTYTVNSNADTDTAGDQSACTNGEAGCTLRAAITVANGDGVDSTINVQPDRYDRDPQNGEYVVQDDGSLIIHGTSGNPQDQIISADGLDRVFEQFTNSHLTLSNVTVQDGFTGNTGCDGAGVRVNPGDGGTTTLTVDNSRIIKNVEVCTDDGGGIWAGSSTDVVLNGSHVENNNTNGDGGGIYHEGDLTLTNSTVTGNTATGGRGGGISDEGTSLNATGSDISGNIAEDGDGGGIYHGVVESSDVTLTDTHVDNNVAYGSGGGIYTDSGLLTLTRVTVDSNKANGFTSGPSGDGGGIYQEGEGLNATDTSVDDNYAQLAGGGVANEEGPASFSGGSVSGNRAQGLFNLIPTVLRGNGGGILNEGADEDGNGLHIDGTDINDNVTNTENGGGIANTDGDLEVRNAAVNGNKAGSRTFCIIFGELCTTATTRGGGIYNDAGDVTIANSAVNENEAELQGGGVFNIGGNMVVEGTDIDRNLARKSEDFIGELLGGDPNAPGGGGGVYQASENSLSLTDSHVDTNRSTNDDGGGVYYAGLGDLTVTRTSVDGNYSDGSGGGVYNSGAPDLIVDSSVSKNIAYDNGAGLYENGRGEILLAAKPHVNQAEGSNIQNSTIANNQADVANDNNNGGGIYNDRSDGMILSNVTLAGNLADSGDGGGIYTTSDNVAHFVNTIVADNQANGPDDSNCGGASGPTTNYTSDGDNVENKGNQDPTGTDCNLVDGTKGDHVVTDVKLGPLQDNGGPTLTRALLDGSVALDAVTDNTCPDPDHDQRQAHRPVGSACDSGAYEGYSLGDLAITKEGPAQVTTGGSVSYTLHVTNNGPDKILAVHVHDALPGGVTLVSASPSQGSCSGSVDCDLGAMASGATATITIVVTAPGSATTLTNTATVSGAPTDPDGSNNEASVQTQVVAPGAAPLIQQQQGSAPQVQGGPRACLTTPPRTSISLPALFASSNSLRFVGRSIDLRCLTGSELGIKTVKLAVAFKAGKKCRFLTKKGTLGKATSCKKPKFLKAKRGKLRNGKVPWTFRMRHLNLPSGRYLVIALGIDTNNDAEKKLRIYNQKTFTIH